MFYRYVYVCCIFVHAFNASWRSPRVQLLSCLCVTPEAGALAFRLTPFFYFLAVMGFLRAYPVPGRGDGFVPPCTGRGGGGGVIPKTTTKGFFFFFWES